MRQAPDIRMFHADCMEFMAGVSDGYYDLAIVDPPYGIGEDGGSNHSRGKLAAAKRYQKKQWDRQRPTSEYFAELRRVSKNQVIWGGQYFADLLPPSSGWLVWDKDNSGDFADCEMAWTSFSVAVRKFKWRWNGMLQQDMANKEKRIHPTQKPVSLYKWALTLRAKPGFRILDTHGGSGSICIACYELGYDLDWVEKDAEYYADAVKRYQQRAKQPLLF